MEGVKFNEPENSGQYNVVRGSKFATFLVNKKIARDINHANLIMVISAVIFLAIALVIPFMLDSEIKQNTFNIENDPTLKRTY